MSEHDPYESLLVVGFFITLVVGGLCFCCLIFSDQWKPVIESALKLFTYATTACCGACTGLTRTRPRAAVAPATVPVVEGVAVPSTEPEPSSGVVSTLQRGRAQRPLASRGNAGALAGCVELLTCMRCCGCLPRPTPLPSYAAGDFVAVAEPVDDGSKPTTALLGYRGDLPLLAL